MHPSAAPPPRRTRLNIALVAGATAVVAVAAVVVVAVTAGSDPDIVPAGADGVAGLDLSAANRRAPIDGLYDWSKAGYRGGADLPGSAQYTQDAACRIEPDELAGTYGVAPDDGADDSAGLQAAIDAVRDGCSPQAGYDALSTITLPAGTLNVSTQLAVDADFLVVRGAGSGEGGTHIAFAPDENTAYDSLTGDGSDWDEDGMRWGDGKGGWIWPGRGLFRVQSRQVDEDYAEDFASAPDNRRDLFWGTVNVHWKSGVELREKPGDPGFSARAGDTVVYLADDGSLDALRPGGLVNIRAANTKNFYASMNALPTEHDLLNQHMRQQIFTVTAVDASARTVTLDKPLEYDVPVDSTSDGSAEIDGKVYPSRAAPLVDPVLGVGIENLSFTQVMPDLDPADAVHNYGNTAPAMEMHGIVFKWAADSWVRGVRADMTGSHPVVTEEAYHLQIVGNHFDGSWNKGKGGNGYFRGSRVWDSLYAGNTTRNLRHFTFQWSASGNVVIGNDFDSDLNLHGGWERNNLFELNTVAVPYGHRPGNCAANCGGEGGETPDDSAWYPIWWGAGQKAVKWSGASGPRNVFHNNTMTKQTEEGGAFTPYYDDPQAIYQFGWDGEKWAHLSVDGQPIADWAGNETADFTGNGVYTGVTDDGPSLFLRSVEPGEPGPTSPEPTSPPGSPPASSSPSPEPTDPPTTVDPAACLTATFAKTSESGDRFTAEVVITNGCAEAVDGWTVTFDLPDGTEVTKVWNAEHSADGVAQSFTNLDYNGDIDPGESEDFGFNASGSGEPSGCAVNGSPCGGG